MIFSAIVVIVLGLLMMINPTVIWTFTERWKSNDGTDPSDIYLLSMRFGGVLCIIVGLWGIFVLVFLE